jgi:hypothetical protein
MSAEVEAPAVALVRRAQSSDEILRLEHDGPDAAMRQVPRCRHPARTAANDDEGA